MSLKIWIFLSLNLLLNSQFDWRYLITKNSNYIFGLLFIHTLINYMLQIPIESCQHLQ